MSRRCAGAAEVGDWAWAALRPARSSAAPSPRDLMAIMAADRTMAMDIRGRATAMLRPTMATVTARATGTTGRARITAIAMGTIGPAPTIGPIGDFAGHMSAIAAT